MAMVMTWPGAGGAGVLRPTLRRSAKDGAPEVLRLAKGEAGGVGGLRPTLPAPTSKLAGDPVRRSAKDGAPEVLRLVKGWPPGPLLLRKGCASAVQWVRTGRGCGVELVGLYVPGQAEQAQGGDAVPVGVELVPGQAVARGLGMGVVVVVPAFAEGEQRDPEAVARRV